MSRTLADANPESSPAAPVTATPGAAMPTPIAETIAASVAAVTAQPIIVTTAQPHGSPSPVSAPTSVAAGAKPIIRKAASGTIASAKTVPSAGSGATAAAGSAPNAGMQLRPTSQALEEVRKTLTPEERAELAEAQVVHGVGDKHPVFMLLLERVWMERKFAEVNADIRKTLDDVKGIIILTAERVEKAGIATAERVEKTGIGPMQFTIEPTMSVAALVLSVCVIAALAWTAGAAVAGARYHESIPLWPFFGLLCLLVGLFLGHNKFTTPKNTAPESKRANSW